MNQFHVDLECKNDLVRIADNDRRQLTKDRARLEQQLLETETHMRSVCNITTCPVVSCK